MFSSANKQCMRITFYFYGILRTSVEIGVHKISFTETDKIMHNFHPPPPKYE